MELTEEEKRELKSLLDDFEKFRKKKYRQHKFLRGLNSFNKLFYYPAIACFAISCFLPFLFGILWPVMVAGLVMFLIHVGLDNYLFKNPEEAINRRFKEEIMPLAINKINPEFKYQPYKKFHLDSIKDTRLFKNEITNYYGEDYISGKIQNVDVEFCEAQLWTTKATVGTVATSILTGTAAIAGSILTGGGDFEGTDATKTIKFFSGLIMRADFHKSFKGGVLVIPKKVIQSGIFKVEKYQGLKINETDNVVFNQEYSIFTSGDFVMNYVLTPLLMDRLLEMNKLLKAQTYISVINGRLNLAIHWGKDLFECDLKKGVPTLNDFVSLMKEVKLFEDIIVHLDQNKRIWGEKALL